MRAFCAAVGPTPRDNRAQANRNRPLISGFVSTNPETRARLQEE